MLGSTPATPVKSMNMITTRCPIFWLMQSVSQTTWEWNTLVNIFNLSSLFHFSHYFITLTLSKNCSKCFLPTPLTEYCHSAMFQSSLETFSKPNLIDFWKFQTILTPPISVGTYNDDLLHKAISSRNGYFVSYKKKVRPWKLTAPLPNTSLSA